MDEINSLNEKIAVFSSLIESDNLAIAVEWLVDEARKAFDESSVTDPSRPKDISLIVRYFNEMTKACGDHAGKVRHVGMAGPANLYLITNPCLAGDQIEYLSHLIKAQPRQRHVVLLTSVPDADRDAATQRVRQVGAFPICPAPGMTAYDRLLWLQAKVQSLVAQRVFLLNNIDDVLASVAARWLAPRYGHRLYILEPTTVNSDDSLLADAPFASATVLPDRLARLSAVILRSELSASPAPDPQSPDSIRALFDVGFYLWSNPEVAKAGTDPIEHFLAEGMEMGCKPHPLFEQDYYLAQLPPDQLDEAKRAPLAHYLHYGEPLGYRPHPLFEPTWCRAMLRAHGHWPEGDDVTVSVLARYCSVGGLISPHPLFDPAHYARQVPLQMEGVTLLLHFLEQGLKEGVSPHPLIDIKRLDAGRNNFILSFLTYICQREPTVDEPSPHVLFDPNHFAEDNPVRYAAAAPNLLWAHIIEGNVPQNSPHPLISVEHVARDLDCIYRMAETALEGIVNGHITADSHPLVSGDHIRSQGTWSGSGGIHPTLYYILNGAAQQIDPHPMFSAGYYVAMNHDVATSGQNPLQHYLSVGEARNSKPHPFFDVEFYRKSAPSEIRPGHLLIHYVERAAQHFVAVQNLNNVFSTLLNKAARRSFQVANAANGAADYLKDALHSEYAPPHPTLITETRPLDTVGTAGVVIHLAQTVPVGRPAIASQMHVNAPSGSYDAPEARVSVYVDAEVVGGNDGFITADGVWCDFGLVGFESDRMTVKHGGAVVAAEQEAVLLRRFSGGRKIARAILGCGTSSQNYFHFMFETLPRALLAAEQAPPGTPVLVNDAMPAQHYQALRLMLPNNPLIRLFGHVTYKVHELYAASMPSLVHDAFGDAIPPTDAVRYHPEILRRLARFAEPLRDGAPKRKLFLRRVGAIRNLLNIDELERELVKLGFESVSCEKLDFSAQVRLFANAEAIVAPTGAHLTNMVFAPEGTQVFPLYSNAPGNNFYLWSTMGDLLKQNVVNVAGWRVAGSCAGIAPEAHENFTIPLILVIPFFQGESRSSGTSFGKRQATDILNEFLAAVSEATALSSSWSVVAGQTPNGFEARLIRNRRAALAELKRLDAKGLLEISNHPVFEQPILNHISGLILLHDYDRTENATIDVLETDFKNWSTAPAAASADNRLERLRHLLLAMLYRQPWQLPLLRDLNDLPVEAVPMYLNWLNQSPLLCRAGDDSAYTDFVIRLLDWLEHHLSSERPLSQLLEIGRAIGSLDLGKLLLIEQPLRAVQERRNRLLERLALRDGKPRAKVRLNDGSEGKIRIGILCRTFEKGPDSEAVVAFFRAFDKEHYDICAYSIGLRDRVVTNDIAFDRILRETFSRTTELSSDAATIRAQLIADELDVFLFANATTYGLRDLDKALYHRVAPVQAGLNSHIPMPLGYPSFDAFITGRAKDDDLDLAQKDYVETLIRQNGPVTNYLTSLEPRAAMGLTRTSFGLAEDDVVAMSAASLAKMGHDCLVTMMRAVREIPKGRLLLAPYNPGWAGLSLAIPFNRQIAETAKEVGLPLDRITVLGELTVAETEAALSLSDIYLNPFPHGGATMTHLALIYAKPPITLLRQSTRSIDQFLLSALGFDELLAANTDDYIALAQKLGSNMELRKDCAQRLAAADRSVLVGSMKYSRDMREIVEELIVKAAQPMAN